MNAVDVNELRDIKPDDKVCKTAKARGLKGCEECEKKNEL
jgi:hypothetical protein